jgi:membrane protease YdiL (CAAX protease family)
MKFAQAVQNALVLGFPVAIYAVIVHWQSRLAWPEVASRLGLSRGDGRPYFFALAATALMGIVVAWLSSWTSSFKGSMIAPFVGASPTPALVAEAFNYGIVATGIPEELLFRGLIAGVLFRRLPFWKANLLQALIFTLPHLLILLIAPGLWPLAICLPMGLGLALGWLRQASGSIWPAVILHGIPNAMGALWVMNWSR